MGGLYHAKTNKLLCIFSCCAIDGKLLFNSYCASFIAGSYGPSAKKIRFSKIWVVFNNAYRRIFNLPN